MPLKTPDHGIVNSGAQHRTRFGNVLICLMNCGFTIFVCVIFIGCFPPSKEAHIKQVRQRITKAGGESEILKESRVLFPRCAKREWAEPGVGLKDSSLYGLPGIQSLGDVFFYKWGKIRIRVHNSHRDIYFIYLLDPDQPQPAGFERYFERIAGNVGFLSPGWSEGTEDKP